VRTLAYAALVLLGALAVAGCGDGDDEASASWGGPQAAAADGSVDVQGFADYAASVDENWEASPTLAAGEFLRLDRRAATITSLVARSGPEGMGPSVVTVTLDGLPDDSVRAERWTLTFAPEDGTYRLAQARRAQRCRSGRGHAGFSAERCI
jgi:hypothetical protein